MIVLGVKYKDLITGFAGVAIGRVEYITGCNQVLLQPAIDKEGKVPESLWLDEQRLSPFEGAAIIVLNNESSPGFDKQAPKI